MRRIWGKACGTVRLWYNCVRVLEIWTGAYTHASVALMAEVSEQNENVVRQKLDEALKYKEQGNAFLKEAELKKVFRCLPGNVLAVRTQPCPRNHPFHC